MLKSCGGGSDVYVCMRARLSGHTHTHIYGTATKTETMLMLAN
jgi:hypothetical protein